MLTQAKQKIEELDLQNIELIEADAEYIDFNDESFDVILCSTAIVYFKDIPAALRKWYRFLKPAGILGFSCCSEESCGAPLIIEICEKHQYSSVKQFFPSLSSLSVYSAPLWLIKKNDFDKEC